MEWWNIVMFVFVIFFFGASFVVGASCIGDKDNWPAIHAKLPYLLGLGILGTILFTAASLAYFNSAGAVYAQPFSIVVSCLALGMAYTANIVAAMAK